jgi:predicted SAM-dependent methyltransferase
MKLHLGCGNKHIDGFINIDARQLPGVDVICDVNSLPQYKNDTIDLIYSSHVLEHTRRHEYMGILKRWCELLKEGGMLRLAIPDMEQVIKHYNIHGDLRLLRGFLWGGQTYNENYHYMGWDFKTIKEDLQEVGFKTVERYDWRNTEHSHIDDFSQCYLPHMEKEFGMLMSLNVEAIK